MKSEKPNINFVNTTPNRRRIVIDGLPLDLMYPVSYQILSNLHEHGFSEERKAMILHVFGDLIFQEIGCDPVELLDLAEKMDRNFKEVPSQ